MSIREKIGEKFELKNINQIKDAAIQALKNNEGIFFEKYTTTITIEGKINENGMLAIFKVDSDKLSTETAFDETTGPIVEKLQDFISKRLTDLKEKLTDSNMLQQVSISFGINVPMLAKNVITITLIKV